MENQTLLQKIRSVKYCLMAHPHNEPDSEFADRINDLQEIEDSLAEHQARQQPVRKTLDECKDIIAKKKGYSGWNFLLSCTVNDPDPNPVGRLDNAFDEVAELYANQSEQGWVDVKTAEKIDPIIGRKCKGFKFKDYKYGGLVFNDIMRQYVGQAGEVQEYSKRHDGYYIRFENGDEWNYPAELVKKNLVPAPTPTTNN